MEVKFRKSKFFDKTLEKQPAQIKDKLKSFILWKKDHPDKPFGGSDYAFAKNSTLGGYYHAHLNRDMSLIYKLVNSVVMMYGIYSHRDSGTGTPSNPQKQKSLKQKLDNVEL